MKDVSMNKENHTSCYVAVPTGDNGDDLKAVKNVNTVLTCKLRLFIVLLLLGISLHFMLEFMFHERTSKFMHFGKSKPPCHHHVRFNPSPHEMHPHFMPPSDIHHENHDQYAPIRDGIFHPVAPIVTESENPSTWKHFGAKDSFDDSKDSFSSDSSDSADDSSDLDMWEHIADFLVGNKNSLHDTKDSSDVSSLDVWERIADVWVGSSDRNKESSDDDKKSSDDNENEDVWERIADMWKSLGTDNDEHTNVASTDEKK